MTTIGRPLRGAQLVTPPYQPRISDSRAAAAARQRTAIRNAFTPSNTAVGSGSIRIGTRPAPGRSVPRTAVIPGAAPRGRIGVTSWNAVERHGGLSAKFGSLLMPTAILFGAFFILTILFVTIFSLRLMSSLRRHLDRKYQQTAQEFRDALQALDAAKAPPPPPLLPPPPPGAGKAAALPSA